jgi:hypothetical protein
MALTILEAIDGIIARSGFTGILLQDLWSQFETKMERELVPQLKNFIWKHLVSCSKLAPSSDRNLSFFMSQRIGTRSASNLPEGLGLRDPTRREALQEELEAGYHVLEKEYNGLWLRVVASQRRRARELTIRDPNHGMTAAMYAVLETVNCAGEGGTTQVDISNQLGLDGKNVFHFIKGLSGANYIKRRQVVVTEDRRKFATVHIIMTKWANAKGHYEAAEAEEDAAGEEGAVDEVGPALRGRLTAYTDLAFLVCQKLNSAKGQLLLSVDLHAFFRRHSGTAATRWGTWVVIRRQLVKSGYVSLFVAELPKEQAVANNFSSCLAVKLLKMPQSPKELDRAFILAQRITTTAYLPLYQGLPLEYQIYQKIVSSGAKGVLQSDIKYAGISVRLLLKRIEKLSKIRKCVSAVPTSVGKIRTQTLKALKEGLTEFEEQVVNEAAIPSNRRSWKEFDDSRRLEMQSGPQNPRNAQNSQNAQNANNMDIDPSAQQSENDRSVDKVVVVTGTRHRARAATTKYFRRRKCLMEALEERKVIPRMAIKTLVNQNALENGEELCDAKVTRKLASELVDEGFAYVVSTSVRTESGASKAVELLVHSSIDAASRAWRDVLNSMSLDDILCNHLFTRGSWTRAKERVKVEELDLLEWKGRGRNLDDSIVLSDDEGSQAGSSYDEASDFGDDNRDEDGEAEQVEFMDSDEEERVLAERHNKAQQRKARAAQSPKPKRKASASKRNTIEEEDNEEADGETQAEQQSEAPSSRGLNDDFHTYLTKLAWGMERAVLQRVNVLHSWLCHHFWGNKIGSLSNIIPNDVQAVVQSLRAHKQKEQAHRDFVGNGPSKATDPKHASRLAAGESGTDLSGENASQVAPGENDSSPSDPNHSLGPSSLLAALFGRRGPTHNPSHETGQPPAEISQARAFVTPSGTVESANDTVQEVSWELARKRWFAGPSFHLESLLLEMPLYVYLKIIGISEPPPDLPNPLAALNEKIRDLPPKAQSALLHRKAFGSMLQRLVECLKKLNLLQPQITYDDDEDGADKAENTRNPDKPFIPKYILNPIGVIWRKAVPEPYEKGQINLPERSFLYEFDSTTPTGHDASVTNYWWRLKRESIALLKEVLSISQAVTHFNKAPPGREFPKAPGLPNICVSNLSWSGRSERLNNHVLKANYELLKAESEMQPKPNPGLVNSLAEQLDLSVNAINRWVEQRTKQLEAREAKKKRTVVHDFSAEPARKRFSRRAIEEDGDEEENSGRAFIPRTVTKPAADAIRFQLPVAVTAAASQSAPASRPESQSNSASEPPREATITTQRAPEFARSARRWSQREYAALVDMFVKQKARSGAYLDDVSNLFEGIDREAMSRATGRRWEVLAGYLEEAVSTQNKLFEMATRIAKAKRELEDQEGENIAVFADQADDLASTSQNQSTMQVDDAPPPFVIELPASIEEFRAQNSIIYSNSSEFFVARGHRRDLESSHGVSNAMEVSEATSAPQPEEHPADPNSVISGLGFSETTKKSFHVLPLSEEHAIRLAESGFYHRGAELAQVAVCPRAPPSVWMLPNPHYAVLSDHIKTWLLWDVLNDQLVPIVRRLLGDCPQSVYDDCFLAMQARRIVTHAKGMRRPHLSAPYSLWTKGAEAAVEFGAEARRLNKAVWHNELAGVSSEASQADADPVQMHPWTLPFDPFAAPAAFATMLNGMESQNLYVDLQIASLAPIHRRSRKQVTVLTPFRQHKRAAAAQARAQRNKTTNGADDANSSAADANATQTDSAVAPTDDVRPMYSDFDDVALQVRWWREPAILSRHGNPEADALVSHYQHPIDEASIEAQDEEDEPDYEVLNLEGVSEAIDAKSKWALFVELLQWQGYDETFIGLAESVLSVIRDANAKAIELPVLEETLVRQNVLERYEDLPVSYMASYEGHTLLMEVLDQLVMQRLVIRVLGETDEAWVAIEHSTCWTIPYLHGLGSDASSSGDAIANEQTVVFMPWHQLDGSLNVQLLSKLRAHIALMIIEAPGISEESILDQFDLYRPAVARELIKLLINDDMVSEKFRRFETPSLSSASSQTISEVSDVKLADESEYYLYLRWKRRFILQEAPPPAFTVSRDFWPKKDIQLRI